MAIITTEELAKYLGILELTAEQEAMMAPLVDGVCSAIANYCDRVFDINATITEYADGDGTRHLRLKHYPANSITSITWIAEDDTEILVASSDYQLKSSEGDVRLKMDAVHSGSWIVGEENYKVVYSSGYAAVDVPKDLKLAALIWGAYYFKKNDQKLDAVFSMRIGDQSVSYLSKEIPDEVKGLLEPYRRPPYA